LVERGLLCWKAAAKLEQLYSQCIGSIIVVAIPIMNLPFYQAVENENIPEKNRFKDFLFETKKTRTKLEG
jgi:hypothetical protein